MISIINSKEIWMSVPAYATPIYRFLMGYGELTFGPEPFPQCGTIWEIILSYGHDDAITFRLNQDACFTMLELKESAKCALGDVQDNNMEAYISNMVNPGIRSNRLQCARLAKMLKEVHADPRHAGQRLFEAVGVKVLTWEEFEKS